MTKLPQDSLARKLAQFVEKDLNAALNSQPIIFNANGTPQDTFILKFKLSNELRKYHFDGFIRLKDSSASEIKEFFGEYYLHFKEDIKKYIPINRINKK